MSVISAVGTQVDTNEHHVVDATGLVLASGVPTLLRAGDFYGHGVNLASRVTGTARPGSVHVHAVDVRRFDRGWLVRGHVQS